MRTAILKGAIWWVSDEMGCEKRAISHSLGKIRNKFTKASNALHGWTERIFELKMGEGDQHWLMPECNGLIFQAQGALNNCVLGNTTIFAESPSETDVLQLLQHLGHSTGGGQNSGQSSGSWRPGGKPEPSYSQGLWAGGNNGNSSSGNSLWGDSNDQHRSTPSSINSFLPGDLLGEGSI